MYVYISVIHNRAVGSSKELIRPFISLLLASEHDNMI